MNIILIDDDELVCFALKTILEAKSINVLGIGHSAKDAFQLYEMHRPDIVIMDIRMGKETGLDGAREILQVFPNAKILFLTTFSDDDYIIQALKMGAKGYFLKQNYEGIADSLLAIQQGKSVFGNDIMSRLPGLMKDNSKKMPTSFGLTDKEMELIACVSEGMSNKEIASTLYLSEGTVRNYLSAICDKLDINSRTQLVIFYYQNLR